MYKWPRHIASVYGDTFKFKTQDNALPLFEIANGLVWSGGSLCDLQLMSLAASNGTKRQTKTIPAQAVDINDNTRIEKTMLYIRIDIPYMPCQCWPRRKILIHKVVMTSVNYLSSSSFTTELLLPSRNYFEF